MTSPNKYATVTFFFQLCLFNEATDPGLDHIRHITSVCVVFCMIMYSFAAVIKRMPPLMFNDTAITDLHSNTFFKLRVH